MSLLVNRVQYAVQTLHSATNIEGKTAMEEKGTKQSRASSLLETLTRRPEVKELWFNKKTISLDGYNFIGCRFDNCELQVSSPHFEMHRCFLGENNKIYYDGDIIKVIRLFNNAYKWIHEKYPYFAPEIHEDSTITIRNTGS